MYIYIFGKKIRVPPGKFAFNSRQDGRSAPLTHANTLVIELAIEGCASIFALYCETPARGVPAKYRNSPYDSPLLRNRESDTKLVPLAQCGNSRVCLDNKCKVRV